MANTKTIHIVHAADGDQHLGKLKSLLENFIKEKRLMAYSTIPSDTVQENSFDAVGEEDLVIVLLTSGIEPDQKKIEEILLKLKDRREGTKIAEIIVDNIPYELQFMAFPDDLQPIRDRENMDAIWQEIGGSLREQFVITGNGNWKKWAKYAAAAVILVGLIYFVPKIIGSGPEPEFSFLALDPVKGGDPIPNAESCYLPCKLFLNDQTANAKKIKWQLGDTTILDNRNPEYVVDTPGTLDIKLTAIKGGKERTTSKELLIKAPPYAVIDAENNGCTAPCDIKYINKSEGATEVAWKFTDGLNPPEVADKNTLTRRYSAAGDYKAELSILNEDGISADTVQMVTILENAEIPFPDFTARKTSGGTSSQQNWEFTNNSRNGKTYVWNWGDGSQEETKFNTNKVSHQFNGYATYAVTLKVIGPTGETREFAKPIYVRRNKYGLYDRVYKIDPKKLIKAVNINN